MFYNLQKVRGGFRNIVNGLIAVKLKSMFSKSRLSLVPEIEDK